MTDDGAPRPEGPAGERGPVPEAERAQWEQAARVQAQREAEARARAERDVDLAATDAVGPRSKRTLVVALAVGALFLLAVGVMLVAIRHRSAQEPAWVAGLGLNGADDGGGDDVAAPDRLGPTEGAASEPSTPTTDVDGSSVAPGRSIDGASEGRPIIDATGEDFDRIWHQIEVLESWLLEHPQPASAAEIYQVGSAPYADLVGQLTDLQSKGQHGRVDGYQILGVTVDARPSPDRVDLRYADTYTDRLTLDASGMVVADVPYDGRARLWTLTLERGPDGRWRVTATAFVKFGDVVAPAAP